MSLSFTRREFYDLVWSKPMIHLAKELGVSDVALHKIGRKHKIPNPPLGWWAKKAAGKSVEQTPLPEVETNRPDTIFIRNAPAAVWKTQALEMAEEKAKSAPQSSAAIPKRGSAVVRNTLAALRRGKANDQPSRFSDGAQTVKFEITEEYTREKHELTRKEKAERAAWEKRSERRGWHYVHGDPHPIFADWDYNPTGRLSIPFEPVWSYRQPTPRRSFNDGKRQCLEDLVDKIAIGIAVVAAAKAERKRRDDEQARLYEEQRQRREMEARLEYIEERRSDELAILLDTQSRVEKLETLLALAHCEPGDDIDSRVQEFRHWLQGQVNETRALLTPAGLEGRFSELNLFGHDDDRDFRPTSL